MFDRVLNKPLKSLTIFVKSFINDIWEGPISQPEITCLKLAIASPEEDVEYLQINDKDTKTTQMAPFCCLYC